MLELSMSNKDLELILDKSHVAGKLVSDINDILSGDFEGCDVRLIFPDLYPQTYQGSVDNGTLNVVLPSGFSLDPIIRYFSLSDMREYSFGYYSDFLKVIAKITKFSPKDQFIIYYDVPSSSVDDLVLFYESQFGVELNTCGLDDLSGKLLDYFVLSYKQGLVNDLLWTNSSDGGLYLYPSYDVDDVKVCLSDDKTYHPFYSEVLRTGSLSMTFNQDVVDMAAGDYKRLLSLFKIDPESVWAYKLAVGILLRSANEYYSDPEKSVCADRDFHVLPESARWLKLAECLSDYYPNITCLSEFKNPKTSATLKLLVDGVVSYNDS